VHTRARPGADHLVDTFSRWAAAGGATVAVAGDDIHVTTCRPLVDGSTDAGVGASLRVIFARNQLTLAGIAAGWSVTVAHCMADRALIELPLDTLTAASVVLPRTWAAHLDQYARACGA
jgi:hypothetical protein